MRLAVLLNPKSDFIWTPSDQYKLRGVIWKALKGTTYEKLHEQSDTPTFTFSNVFTADGQAGINDPITENTPSILLMSSPHPNLLDIVAADFDALDKLEIGDNMFTIDRIESREINAGRVGEQGTIKTQTGLYLRLPPEEQEKYNINSPYEESTISWTPDHGLKLFKERLLDNINWKINTLDPTVEDTPDTFQDIFNSVSVKTTFEANVNVTEDYAYTFIPSVCEFEYTVTDNTHRRWINTLFDSGLGWKNALGFGFLNRTDTSNLT